MALIDDARPMIIDALEEKPARRRSAWRRPLRTAAFHLSAGSIALLWFAPIALVLLMSFRTFDDIARNGVGSLPQSFSLTAYPDVWEGAGMAQALLNSFLITIPTVALSLFLSSIAAFGLSRYRIRFWRAILLIMLAGNLLPVQVILIPVAKMAESLGLYDSLFAVIGVQTAFGLGFYTFVLYGFMRGIPNELQDAASIDGAGVMRTYWQVVLPLCKPALAALGALAFTWIFNDLLLSLTLLQTDSKFPITAAVLSLLGQYGGEWNLIAAATVIAALPCVIVFLIFQRSFIGGLALGAVK
ncbi:carbohydrate ABC transporter membrane protein 2 (CUT1 family) [Microbacterium sp. SLBN-154]|uniref:carbohydrate ABC transporter permease n=1 Tax=Microbacterium sp. SLBN-154 TaxID=2768458 RepID=UPI00116EBD1B|nr:carbohydrate ABC transporter permease [Microbacterium sp. SLBN-154]TQK17664.1 carbohydrate ABC transporter membrane protein 2 (CUT1 family) [Microbacterium sp. SLBN-154]